MDFNKNNSFSYINYNCLAFLAFYHFYNEVIAQMVYLPLSCSSIKAKKKMNFHQQYLADIFKSII